MKTIDCWIRVIRKSSLHWTRHVERSTLNFQFLRFSLLNWTINNINASFTWIGFSSVNKSKWLALTLFPLSSHYFLFTFLEFRFYVGSLCAVVLSMFVCVAFKMCIFIIQARDRIERKMYVLSWFFFLFSRSHWFPCIFTSDCSLFAFVYIAALAFWYQVHITQTKS